MIESIRRNNEFIPVQPINKSNYKNLLNIILNITNYYDFYDNYDEPKIAYNVWESTRQPNRFFNQLKSFDQFWVPSTWQRDCTIEQGFPKDKIYVVPEGIDPKIFFPLETTSKDELPGRPDTFKFFLTGRWEPRKSTTEIIQAFISEFGKHEDVELILNVDNPFPVDDCRSTEERLVKYKLEHPNIIVEHFMSQDKYVNYLQNIDCFLSCSRAEGWNLPLIEALACGAPAIYSRYGAQMDFAQGIAWPVNIVDHKTPSVIYNSSETPGTWAEPDYEQLQDQMRYVYENATECRIKSFISSHYIREQFKWEKAVEKALMAIEELESPQTQVQIPENIKNEENVSITYGFVNGAYLEVTGESDKEYTLNFYDKGADKLVHKDTLPINMWSRTLRAWFTDWNLSVECEGKKIFEHDFDAKGKKVFIVLDSRSLGDTLAWFPYIDDFRVKHKCKVVVSTFWNELLRDENSQIEFVESGSVVHDIYAQYTVGCFDNLAQNKNDWRETPLQKICADILGLDYKEKKPRLRIPKISQAKDTKLVTLSEAATAGCKQWQCGGGWQKVVDFLNDSGFKVVVISKEPTELEGVINQTNQTIDQTINNIAASKFYMGVSSGPAWLAWALNVPVLMVSGCTKPWNEFQTGIVRIHNPHVCNGCFNNKNYTFDKGDWWWCPAKQDFICTKSITPQQVIDAIKKNLI